MSDVEPKVECNDKPYRDLAGQKFNMLTVESFSHYSKSRYPYWNCKCDCGNASVVCEYNLQSGNTKSCGCLKRSRAKNLRKETSTCYGGAQIERLTTTITRRNNTSGFRGVSWVERIGKWRVNLTFRGTRYHLGYYANYDEAVNARLEGEQMVDTFIIDYFDNVLPEEAGALAKLAFENQIKAKVTAETEFKRIICKNKDYGLISPHTDIIGNIQTDEFLLVSGSITGDINCSKSIMVNGAVRGNIFAEAVYIPMGKVVGNITAQSIFCSNIHAQVLGRISGITSPYKHLDADI